MFSVYASHVSVNDEWVDLNASKNKQETVSCSFDISWDAIVNGELFPRCETVHALATFPIPYSITDEGVLSKLVYSCPRAELPPEFRIYEDFLIVTWDKYFGDYVIFCPRNESVIGNEKGLK